ncbi:MAG: hypothetical protein HYU80_04280 [Candidatus Blackburnbacteria bacterium]|nr:hypothetical protein [Candidatus Blackburnbacteria bacterium]
MNPKFLTDANAAKNLKIRKVRDWDKIPGAVSNGEPKENFTNLTPDIPSDAKS